MAFLSPRRPEVGAQMVVEEGYWYSLASRGLVLDLVYCSVTLEAPLTMLRES